MEKHPFVLTIAGFDPSSGAGLTADVKTLEALSCYGLAVQTANTIQTDTEFVACHWTAPAIIKEQLEVLLKKFEIEFIKVGIIESWELLLACITLIKKHSTKAKIILDPVLRSSTNFEFQSSNEALFDKLLDELFLITPNYEEIQKLFVNKSTEATIQHISSKTNLFLKGGHRKEKLGEDELFTKEGEHHTFSSQINEFYPKHGSGCVLSSTITAYLALGYALAEACEKGKRYIERFSLSNDSLLGYHALERR